MYGKTVFRCRLVSYISLRCYKTNNNKKLLEFLAKMPKVNTPRISEAQRQRQHISKKSEKYGPSTVYLQVIGSGARGAPNTLYLFTDQKRYLFNCGEGTQRLAHEHKIKLSRLEHVFITSKTWRNIGGLPGLSLTLQDVGVPNITLHGPEGLDELYSATRRFVIMKDMNVTMAKCSPSEDFEDNVMNVKYVLLGPHDNLLEGKEIKPVAKKQKLENPVDKEFEEFTRDDTDYYRQDIRNHDANKNNRMKDKEKPKASFDKDAMKKKTENVLHELQKKSHCSVAYICTLKKRLGTLDLAKCVEFGVKPGPLLGQLKNGQDVVLPDGTLVLSKDVKTPDDPGPVFIVLEVPDLSYLKESEFSAHFDNGTNPPENIPRLVVHYTPPHVFNHSTYRSFMAMFGPTTRHLVLNTQNSCLGSEAVHRTQHKLHLLDSDIFPLLRDASLPAVWNSHPPLAKTNSPVQLKGLEELKNKIALAQFQNIINMEGSCKGDGHCGDNEEENKLEIIAGRTLSVFHLRPKKTLDRSLEPKLHIQDYIQETMDVDGFVTSLEQFRRQVETIRYTKGNVKEYPKVVFLGTGSCIPSKTRNTSGIAVQIDENRSMLMDCGEGTYGQLVRFYGPKRVDAFLRTLKAIYVSHLHADHHIGLIGVLQARRRAFEDIHEEQVQPVYLLAPGQIVTWLSLYDQQFERIRADFTLIPNQTLIQDAINQNNEMTSAVLASIGVQQIQTCFVSHCPNAFGVAVNVDGQFKLTYSGDTIPCEELVKIGENSTILIHEATMEDELADEARIKMHSTTSQAIEAGRLMRAQYTLLTHFSQRYARLPRLNQHILNDNHTVGIAFDNMQITMGDLELLPYIYAPLQLMFAEHCVEMELKAAHRARQKERISPPASASASVPAGTDHAQAATGSCTKNNPCRVAVWAPATPVAITCQAANSAPARVHARYRESHASRLRQELKGMTITGFVRRRRSNSSPTKTQPSTPTRTTSETSNVSREQSERSKVVSNASSKYVIDSRSKTINTECRVSCNDNIIHGTTNGYGKPLVTPLNKKITIMRDISRSVKPSEKDKKNPVSRNRSPIKAEHKGMSSPIIHKKLDSSPKLLYPLRVDIVGSVLLHLIYWRMARVATLLYPGRSLLLFTIIAVGVLFWTAAKSTVSGNKLRCSTNPNTKPGTKHVMGKLPVPSKQARIPSTSPNRYNNSPNRQVRSANDTKGSTSYSKMKTTKLSSQNSKGPCSSAKTEPYKNSSCVKRPCPEPRARLCTKDTKSEAVKNDSVPLRDILTELKRPLYKDLPGVGRLGSGIYSNRSFKPQLEDIKSSFLLLNKKGPEEKFKANVDHRKPKEVPRPMRIVNEEQRRKQIVEAKQKFQSKQFWNDSRYDKIEGLNWISWK
ncbi:ribonuclease Z, mitochondrial [Achroia grisella]|uniref:ribonuclease Z, mitochondrial n=1 Tax=Achroia grisella TaxID=688607 RepID=UPI0027D20319|nr:ribonuclease Z, mitochondrial [Achroia grisella]